MPVRANPVELNLGALSNIPPKPPLEISRDNVVAGIKQELNSNRRELLLVSGQGLGRTNTLAQFARLSPRNCISYFISEDPYTQRLDTYLSHMCAQIGLVMNRPFTEASNLHQLRSSFTSLCVMLAKHAVNNGETYYFVLDGLEHAIDNRNEEGTILSNLPSRFSNSPYLVTSVEIDSI